MQRGRRRRRRRRAPSGPHRCTEDGPGGTRGGVPHHEPRRGATVVPLRARKREEIAASFVRPPHPLPCLLAARAGEGRRAPWRRGRRWDSRCPEDVQRDNTLFVDPAATSRRTACFSSPLPLLLFSSLSSFRFSFSPFIRPSSFHPLSAPWSSVFVLGFSTRVLVSQFLNKKNICGGYILLLSGRAERSMV